MIFEKIDSSIKIRKFNREKNVLTLKADMFEKEYQLIQDILADKIINIKATTDKEKNPEGKIIKEKFNFLHNFIISKVKIMTQEDLIKAKKTVSPDDENDEYKLVEVSLDDIEGIEEVEDGAYEDEEFE